MSITQKSSHQTHEAVVFFANGGISKEMLYTEFEALLDCVVPVRDFAGHEMEAAYVRLDPGLSVVAAVLFLVNFDTDGFPEQSWNVPLRMLAESAGRGPDLGGGPARLATRSQCPVQGYAPSLWDIQVGPNGNTLEVLRERLLNNRLGIDAMEMHPQGSSSGAPAWNQPPGGQGWAQPPQQQAWAQPQPPPQQAWAQSQPPPQQAWPQPAPSHPAPAPAMQPAGPDTGEALRALQQQSNQQLAQMKEQHQRELIGLQERLAEQQQRALALENEKGVLLAQLNEQTQASDEEHRRSERKLQMVIDKSRTQTTTLRQELEQERDTQLAEQARRASEELEARLREAAGREREAVERLAAHQREAAERIATIEREAADRLAALERQSAEQLAARERRAAEEQAAQELRSKEEAERFERERQQQEEQLQSLRAELTELRRDKLRLMGEGADKFFVALKEKGVKFVAFQPGAGHLTIPMEDIYRYIEDTGRFVADKCGVSEEHYLRWLAHYQNPVCQGSAGHGGPCAKPLTKILKPVEFTAGLHDRCDIHKQVPRSPPRDKSA